jgi:diguanylate cyclase (GGDEF)-like protein
VVMMDLDHFNRFNNEHGHQAGDALLQAFGDMMQRQFRAEDIPCRYGGEEFVVILPEAPPEVTRRRAEQIRQGTKDLRVQQRGQVLPPVTVSIGVAQYPQDGTGSESLIRAADQALYRAKGMGRDRVVGAKDDPAPKD